MRRGIDSTGEQHFSELLERIEEREDKKFFSSQHPTLAHDEFANPDYEKAPSEGFPRPLPSHSRSERSFNMTPHHTIGSKVVKIARNSVDKMFDIRRGKL